jgi:hypothetical protein
MNTSSNTYSDVVVWQSKNGDWKAKYENYTITGRTEDCVRAKILDYIEKEFPDKNTDPCDFCDPLYNPLCNRCLGS